MKYIRSFAIISIVLYLVACSSPEKSESSAEESQTAAKSTKNISEEISGFADIKELAASVVASLKDNDYKAYHSHSMTETMEKEMAKLIPDSEVREEFLREYGFSLKEEKEYFDDVIKYFKDKNIDLSKASPEDTEMVEYKGGEYKPLELYEIFIPVESEVEMIIDLTVIKVEGKYFLTSELGI